ncbi:hypothetical protein EW026_g2428 [Hermanssonia centrifuga]|uniref:Uncharacterized protein n=1 Tax=Hermanssonia centrifuga TaxID=98765 RepID=A0A4S4KPC6_9APHY|nr:hypothetical protein EW026_g2428 [Hermanssonia centrifuga]
MSEDPRIPAVLNELPTAIWFAFGEDLGTYVRQVRAYEAKRQHKTLVFVCVNSVEEALVAANDWKVDVIAAQGVEAGGHGSSHAPTLSILVSAILAALPNGPPIVAAGGIATGPQVASLLTLGASGVILGTRLLFTPECAYTPTQKSLLLKADLNATTRGMCFDEVNRTLGWPEGIDGRAIANGIWMDAQEGLDMEERILKYDEGKEKGEEERVLVWAGAAAGLTKEIKGAGEVVREIHDGALEALRTAATLF